MTIRLLCIGDELLDGRIANTNQQTITQAVWDAGYTVDQAVSIGDNQKALVLAMRAIGTGADVVICTGGLGPTDDDRTVQGFAQMAALPLVRDGATEADLRAFYAKRNRTMPVSNLKQADIPQGATPIPNPNGTAVGIQHTVGITEWFLLPGVPREMQPMMETWVLPWLHAHRRQHQHHRVITTVKCVGVGESDIADRLASLYPLPEGVTIRYQVPFPEVHVHCCTTTPEAEAVHTHIQTALADCAYTTAAETFGETVVQHLRDQHATVAIAESCTGGRVSQILTAVPGSSSVVLAGVVAYSNASKVSILGVDKALIDAHGAVSSAVAAAMAEAIRNQTGATIGLATTGIAGPDGGTEAKPVGTVYSAIATKSGTHTERLQLSGQRDQIQCRAAVAVLHRMRQRLTLTNSNPSY